MPLVATPVAATQQNGVQQNNNYDFSTTNSNTTQDIDSSTPDVDTNTNTSQGSSNAETSVRPALDLGTGAPQDLELSGDLEDDYTIQRGLDDLNVQDMEVNNWQDVAGGATVETFISGEVPDAHYPFKYPVTVTIQALDDENNDGNDEVISSQKTQVVLKPHTEQTDWSSIDFNNFSDSDLKNYSAYASANFTFNQEASSEYDFRVRLQSTYNGALVNDQVTPFVVNGSNTEDTSNIDAVIQTSDNYRELPTKARVNSFKASTTDAQYMEDLSLPTRGMNDPVGTVSTFANMSAPNKQAATISSENGELRITTAVEYIEPNTPQTLVFRYAMTGETDSINVTPIAASGQEIDPDTDPYELTRDSQQECIEGNVTSVCMINLSEDERDYINQHGELFLSFESSEPTQAQVLCQSVIGGGLDATAQDVCGIKSVSDGASTVYRPTITDFTLYGEDSSGNYVPLDEEDPVNLGNRDPANFRVGVTVKNSGTAPLEGSEPIQVFQNSSFDTPSTETIQKQSGVDYSPDLENESVTFNSFNRRYPTSSIDLEIDGNTNGGVVEIKIEAGGDSVYRTYGNIGGSQTIDLTELGGYTEELNVTVNAVYNDPSDKPTLDSMTAIATDQESDATTQVDLGDFSGGGGDLAPGDTRTHLFDADSSGINLDSSSVLNPPDRPAVTFNAEFGNDTDELIVKKAGEGGANLVADAGGPYNAQLEVDEWTRDQTGYETLVAHLQPGSEWERGEEVNVDRPDKLTYTTTHEDVPKVNLPQDAAMTYYRGQDYVRELEKQLPDQYTGMEIKELKFDNYTGDEMFFGTRSELESESVLSYEDGNWTSEGFTGEDIEGYETEAASMFSNSAGDLEFETDSSDAIYFYDEEIDGTLVPRVVNTVEQENKPNTGEDHPRCSTTPSGEYPCWQRGQYIGTEQQTDGYTDRKCQDWTEYYDPGPDWYLADSSNPGEVCWEKVNVTQEYDQYRWQLIEEVNEVPLQIPQYKSYDQHSRPVYDMEIVWERDRANNFQQYAWSGPRYTVDPEVSPTTINLDGSGSQSKSNVPISDYNWYVEGEKINANSLSNPSVELDGTGRYEVKLEVKGGGMTDTDTTHINANVVCGELNVCSGGDHPELSMGKVTEKVDRKYREAAIEVNLSETPNNGTRFQYRLRVSPAESALTVTQANSCPVGYQSRSFVLPDDSSELESDPLLDPILSNLGPTEVKTVTACEDMGSAPSGAPSIFIHPDSISEEVLEDGKRTFQLNQNGTKTFWKGAGIPEGGLTQIAYINPRYNDNINNGFQEFTVKLQVKDNEAVNSSYETIDRGKSTVEFCKANTVWECPDLNSDLDAEDDETDQCPYTIGRTEFPCEGLPEPDVDEQAMVFGGSTGWEIDENNQDPYIGVQPNHTSGIGGQGTPYSSDTIEVFFDSQMAADQLGINTYAHYPLDYKSAEGDDPARKWQLRETENGYNSQAFIGQQNRSYDNNTHIVVYSPEKSDGERDKVDSIYSWDPDSWSGGTNSAYFTKSNDESEISDSSAIDSIDIGLSVDAGDRGADSGLFNYVNSVDLNSSTLDYYQNEYGNDWHQEYKYEINRTSDNSLTSGITSAPMGRAYSLEPSTDELGQSSKYPYFSIANHNKWPGQANPSGLDVMGAPHTLDETLTNGPYDLSFWYKPTLGESGETEYVIKREIDNNNNISNSQRQAGQDVVVAVTEENVKETEFPDGEIEESEIHFGSYNAGTPPSERGQYARLASSQSSLTLDNVQDGDEIKFVLWADETSDDAVVLRTWNTDGPSDNIPQNVQESDYYIEEYTPMVGQDRKIIAQATHKRAGILYELAYVRPDNFWNRLSKQKYMDYGSLGGNNDTVIERNIRKSGLPFLQLRSRGDNKQVVRAYEGDSWKHATLAERPNSNTTTYYENHDKVQATVNTPDGLNNNAYNNNRLQLHMGGGFTQPANISTFRQWGGKFSGQFSAVRISSAKSDKSVYYPEVQTIYTDTQNVSQEDITRAEDSTNDVDLDDVTFTRDNMRLSPDIEWNENGMQSPTTVRITAEPTNTYGGSVDDEKYMVEYTYLPSLNTAYKTDSVNSLREDTNYTGFRIKTTVDTQKDQEGWKAPEINRVDLLNYNPNVPDVPPAPTGGTVETSGENRRVPAPTSSGGDATDQTDKGGSISVSGQIRYEGADRNVPIKFVVRDNNTTIAEGDIATGDRKVRTFEVPWSALKSAGLEPRGEEYLVEFVVKEDPDGQWTKESIGIGRFILCDKDGTYC